MLAKLVFAWCLVAATVSIHSAGMAIVLARLLHSTAQPEIRFLSLTWRVIGIAWWLIVIHVVEVIIWGLFFWWQGCLPDAESSLYFSGVTYATIGYGDFVLPREWRLFSPLEGLTGILMCGLSTGFFFAVVSKITATRRGRTPAP